jgi:hypothetical protein
MDDLFEVTLILFKRGVGDKHITLRINATNRMHAIEEVERVIRNYIYTDVEIEILNVKPL